MEKKNFNLFFFFGFKISLRASSKKWCRFEIGRKSRNPKFRSIHGYRPNFTEKIFFILFSTYFFRNGQFRSNARFQYLRRPAGGASAATTIAACHQQSPLVHPLLRFREGTACLGRQWHRHFRCHTSRKSSDGTDGGGSSFWHQPNGTTKSAGGTAANDGADTTGGQQLPLPLPFPIHHNIVKWQRQWKWKYNDMLADHQQNIPSSGTAAAA